MVRAVRTICLDGGSAILMVSLAQPRKPEPRRRKRLGGVSLFVAVGILCAVCTGCGTPGAPLHPDGPTGSWYVVKEGETLAVIATRASVPLEDLLEINGLRRRDKVPAGRLIFLLDAQRLRRAVPPPRELSAPVANRDRGSSALFRWPLVAPRLTSAFGRRDGREHEGIDLGAPTGTPILAAGDGEVIYADNGVRGYGNMVVVQHKGDYLTVYAHSSLLLVHVGDKVTAGQEICRVGQTGHATAPHLHFEVRKGQVPADPLRFLPGL